MKQSVGLRVEQEEIARFAELAKRMGKRSGGIRVTTPEAMRAALSRGYSVLNEELGEKPRGRVSK